MEGEERTIKNLLFIFILLLIPQIVSASSNGSCFRDIQKRYANLPGIIVSYKREITSKTMDMLGTGMKEEVATGKIFLRPPNFLRIEQETPDHELIISNGHDVWWYIPSKNTAYRYRAEQFSKELDILRNIFHGMRDVEKRFFVSWRRHKQGINILLRPKKAWQDIEKIGVEVDPSDFRIKVVKIYNLFGSITCFRLRDEISTRLKKQVFSVRFPEGTRIIEK